MSRATVAVAMFCGVGGFCLGSEAAGVPVVLAVDCWRAALAVHAAHFPKCRRERITLGEGEAGSVEAVARLILEAVAGRPYHLHLSPPCQNSSNANAKGDREAGFVLVQWSLDLVAHLKASENPPASWSLEQVRTVIKKLPANVPFVKLSALDFGVPQTRTRMFAGEGWRAVPTHHAAGSPKHLSALDALPHIEAEAWARSDGPFIMTMLGGGNPNSRARDLATEPAPCITSKSPSQMPIRLQATGANWSARDRDRPLDRPSATVCAMVKGGAGLYDHASAPPVRMRSLTVAETLTLQGFPDWFNLDAAPLMGDKWVLAGNAVCPPVAEAVMRGLIDERETLAGWSE